MDPSLFCGACHHCRDRSRQPLRERWGAIGVTVNGGCAEFVSVPDANAFGLPDKVAPRIGAMVEPLSCAVTDSTGCQEPLGTHYLIYGAGTMGQLIQLAVRAGAGSVSVVDRNTDRLPRAPTLGADAVATSADEFDRSGWEVVDRLRPARSRRLRTGYPRPARRHVPDVRCRVPGGDGPFSPSGSTTTRSGSSARWPWCTRSSAPATAGRRARSTPAPAHPPRRARQYRGDRRVPHGAGSRSSRARRRRGTGCESSIRRLSFAAMRMAITWPASRAPRSRNGSRARVKETAPAPARREAAARLPRLCGRAAARRW